MVKKQGKEKKRYTPKKRKVPPKKKKVPKKRKTVPKKRKISTNLKIKKIPRKTERRGKTKFSHEDSFLKILNQILAIMGIESLFEEEDNVLERSWRGSGSFLKEGIKQGLSLLKNYTNDRLDPDCNVVCLTNALILRTILEKEKLSEKLSPYEELYLLCLYYLNRGTNLGSNKVLPLEYALLGIENRIEHARKNYEEKVSKKAQAKKIKKAKGYLVKLEKAKAEIKQKYDSHEPQWRNISVAEMEQMKGTDNEELRGVSYHDFAARHDRFWWLNNKTGVLKSEDKPWSPELWEGPDDKREQVDICRPVSCHYLFESWAKKSPAMRKSIEKLCMNIVSIYKGLTFTLIQQFAEEEIYQYQLESEPIIDETKITLDLKIFSLLENVEFVLIPDSRLIQDFTEEYSDLDEAKWVYTNLQKDEYDQCTMDRTLISELEEKSYLVGLLNSSKIHLLDLRASTGIPSDTLDIYVGDGTGQRPWDEPVLESITLYKKTLNDGKEIIDISENIENSITDHWFIADKDNISDRVELEVAIYGPLFVDNETEALRGEIAELRAKLGKQKR